MLRFRPVAASALAWSMGAVVAVTVGLFSLRHLDGELSGELIHPLVPQARSSQVKGGSSAGSRLGVPQGKAMPGESGSPLPIPFATAVPVPGSSADNRAGAGPGPGGQTGAPPETSAPPPPAPAPAPVVGPDQTFTSAGGNVVAHCEDTNAYLVAWSPAQGYTVDEVNRGPAATADIRFRGNGLKIKITVQCVGGVPSAAISQEVDHSGPH